MAAVGRRTRHFQSDDGDVGWNRGAARARDGLQRARADAAHLVADVVAHDRCDPAQERLLVLRQVVVALLEHREDRGLQEVARLRRAARLGAQHAADALEDRLAVARQQRGAGLAVAGTSTQEQGAGVLEAVCALLGRHPRRFRQSAGTSPARAAWA
jgi:hypothetical protein